MRFWCIAFVFALCFAFFGLVLLGHGGDCTPVTYAIFFAIGVGGALYKLVESGQLVEGLIIAVVDDGIDRLYTTYYEIGTSAYEMDFTAKCKSPAGRLQRGDTVTLILPPLQTGRPRQLVFFPLVLLDLPNNQSRAA
jgi:hypothetical protein